MNLNHYIFGKKIKKLKEFNSKPDGIFKNKDVAHEKQIASLEELIKLQDILYADAKNSVLVILQSLDAGGKDSVIKHVMSGVNPIGCSVHCFPVKSFKTKSALELEHDYMYRFHQTIPTKGRIGLFNRSYYEEVLLTRIHPEIILGEKLPGVSEKSINSDEFWHQRYQEINNFEKYCVNNGIHIIKLFLNISKEEQRQRLLERINTPEKNWKFGMDDLIERRYWDNYMKIYEEIFKATSTDYAPWYIIPADKKWHMFASISNIIVDKLTSLKLKYPEISAKQRQEISEAKKILENDTEK